MTVFYPKVKAKYFRGTNIAFAQTSLIRKEGSIRPSFIVAYRPFT